MNSATVAALGVAISRILLHDQLSILCGLIDCIYFLIMEKFVLHAETKTEVD